MTDKETLELASDCGAWIGEAELVSGDKVTIIKFTKDELMELVTALEKKSREYRAGRRKGSEMTDKNEALKLAKAHGAVIEELHVGSPLAIHFDELPKFLAYTAAVEEKHQTDLISAQEMVKKLQFQLDTVIPLAEKHQARIAMQAEALHSVNEYFIRRVSILTAFERTTLWPLVEKAISANQQSADAFVAEVKAGVWEEAEKICLQSIAEAEDLVNEQNRASQIFAYGEAAAVFSERAAELRDPVVQSRKETN